MISGNNLMHLFTEILHGRVLSRHYHSLTSSPTAFLPPPKLLIASNNRGKSMLQTQHSDPWLCVFTHAADLPAWWTPTHPSKPRVQTMTSPGKPLLTPPLSEAFSHFLSVALPPAYSAPWSTDHECPASELHRELVKLQNHKLHSDLLNRKLGGEGPGICIY